MAQPPFIHGFYTLPHVSDHAGAPVVQYYKLTPNDLMLRLDDALVELRQPLPTTPEGWVRRDGFIRQAMILLGDIVARLRPGYVLLPEEKKDVVELIEHLEGLRPISPTLRQNPNAVNYYVSLKH